MAINATAVDAYEQNRFRWIIRPSVLILVPASVSFLVWAIPWPASVQQGFTDKVPLTFSGALFLAVWYGLIALAATTAWSVGRRVSPIQYLDSANDTTVYRVLTVVAAIGVIGTFVTAEMNQRGVIVHAFTTTQFNLIRQAVPYAPGVSTLRYAAILAGAIAIYRLLAGREFKMLHLLNVGLLVGVVLVASRLSLMLALLIVAGLVALRGFGKSKGQIRVFAVVVIAAVLLLGIANYLRNAGFYKVRDIADPQSMLLSEVVRYVGAPTQVAVATANPHAVGHSPGIADAIYQTLVPTFIAPEPGPEMEAALGWYRESISIERQLTTNSAVAELFGTLSWWALVVMMIPAWFGGLLMGHFSRYRSYMVIGVAVIGYCYVELWRTYLFNDGLIWFSVLILTAACSFEATRSRVGKLYRRLRPAKDERLSPDLDAAITQ